jgi:hypothetical protein
MQDDDPAPGPAASPAGLSAPAAPSGSAPEQGFGRRILDWAMHGPAWSHVVLAVAGVAAALLVAGLRAG